MSESRSDLKGSQVVAVLLVGALLGVIGFAIFRAVRTPNSNLTVTIDSSARGKIFNTTCTVDELGDAVASGGFLGTGQGVLKIGVEFYKNDKYRSVDTGPVYTYFDTGDPAAGQDSGILGFSVVAPAVIVTGRPTNCTVSIDTSYQG